VVKKGGMHYKKREGKVRRIPKKKGKRTEN
jgi:hypothetical protein